MTEYRCPCCGGAITAPMSVDGLLGLPHSPLERRILSAIVAAYPEHVEKPELINAMYWDDPNGGPDDAARTTDVHVYRINRRIAKHGWQIVAMFGNGTRALRRIEQVVA